MKVEEIAVAPGGKLTEKDKTDNQTRPSIRTCSRMGITNVQSSTLKVEKSRVTRGGKWTDKKGDKQYPKTPSHKPHPVDTGEYRGCATQGIQSYTS